MGKADQKKTQNEITRTVDQNQANTGNGISQTGERVANLIDRSDAERGEIQDNYRGMLDNGGITADEANRLRSGNYGGSPSGGGSSSSSSGGGVPGYPDYLSTFYEISGKNGGFDDGRLGNINTTTDKLRNTSGNFGATDTSISGLQDFARTGGIQTDTLGRVYDPTLTELSQTGGYSDADKANIRARSNSGISSYYNNLRDSLARDRASSGSNVNTGTIAGNNFRLARASAQDSAKNLRATEADIAEKVAANRLAAGGKLSDAALGVAGIQSDNTLQGYDRAGQLDISKQGQISRDLEAGGRLDLDTQMGINQSRLAATSGISQDTLGRMSIGASSAAAQNAINAANERFLIGQTQQGRFDANRGLLDTYGTGPQELEFNQDLLRGYRQDQAADNFNTIGARTNASQIPGIGSTIGSGLNVVGKAANIGGGILGGFGVGDFEAPKYRTGV